MELGVVYLVVSGQMLIKTNSKKNLKHKLHFKTIFAVFFLKPIVLVWERACTWPLDIRIRARDLEWIHLAKARERRPDTARGSCSYFELVTW
jgi:hypothetical protein